MPIFVPLESLKQGMITAGPVFNHLGQLLLGKGVELSPRQLTVLKTWGIEKTLVEGGEAEEKVPEVNAAIRKQALARIKQRLNWQPGNFWEEEIFHLAVQQIIHRSLQTGI
jgi:hypothetical protein